MTASPTQDAPRFLDERPEDLRTFRRSHRLAYIIRVLPQRLEALSAQLELPQGSGGRVLDYGCADTPYRRFFAQATDYVAADLPGNPHATVDLNPDGTIPLPDAHFDVVLSTQVLEHVTDPGVYLAECARVLKPGGRLLLSTHGIMVYHPDPDDYWRWTCAGLKRAVEQAGLEIVHFEGIMGLAATGLQLIHDSIFWRLPRSLMRPFSFVVQSLIALADRFERRESRDMNALVFALVARKP
jgi:SAM-dependent methyltransferase